MKHNMSKIDKLARIVIGIGILALGLYYKSWLGLLGFIPIIISLYGWCPIYTLFNYSTLKKEKEIPKAKKKAKKRK